MDDRAELKLPDYSGFIPVMDRRRMSEVLKMSITSAMDCVQQAGISKPDAIIVGTSMGCSIHTKTFLDKIAASQGELIAPTAFIVSTHNTIAGQISLLMKTHGYNMTHTQNTLSFEQALMDAMLCINNGYKHVLAGGADEMESTIYNMKGRLNRKDLFLTAGASFFLLSGEAGESESIKVKDVRSFGLSTHPFKDLEWFLESNSLSIGDIDLVLYENTNENMSTELEGFFGKEKLVDYLQYAGTYYTSSAFAMHLAEDMLMQEMVDGKELKRILVWNNLVPENLGLILLEKNEMV